MKNRIGVVQRLVKRDMLDAFLISSTINIRYLTGFEGTAGLLAVFRDGAFLLVDSRYTLKVKREAMGVNVKTVKDYFEDLSMLLDRFHCSRIGFEEEYLSYKSFRKLSLLLSYVRFYPYTKFIGTQRACKDKKEISIIKKAIAITEKALIDAAKFIRPGVSEKEIADRLEESLRRGGARSSSFRTIVAAPETSSSPHSEPGEKPIPSRGMVLVDVGCDYQGYNSDMTRLFLIGKMNTLEKRILDIVAAAKKKAIAAIRPGEIARDIDQAARGVIEERGYGKYFGHSLGHGVGLSVHEEPIISKRSNTILKEGMVITIEPGIYLPGRFGVRLEDMILVTKRGGTKLTTLPEILNVDKNLVFDF